MMIVVLKNESNTQGTGGGGDGDYGYNTSYGAKNGICF